MATAKARPKKKAAPKAKAAARAKPKVTAPARPAVHTIPHGDGWANRREGSSRVAKRYARKTDAQTAGRRTAQREKTEHIVHNRDGSIGSRNSYGNDPRRTKG